MPTSNPLSEIQYRVPFDQIRAEHVEPAIGEHLRKSRERLDAVVAGGGERTFENTMLVLDVMTEPLDHAMSIVRHLEAVATYPELRQAYNAVVPAVSAFFAGIPLNAGLWEALKTLAATDEARRLTGPRRRFLTKTVADFRRHGAELDAAGKARLEEIDVELTKLTTRFSQNVLDSTNAFELVITDRKQLAGLPPSAIDAARENAASKGIEGWRFTLQAPSYQPVMTYLDDEGIRRRMYRAFNTRATSGEWANPPLADHIVKLRHEKAVMLGYHTFADLVLEDRMAHNGKRAQEFLWDLKERTEYRFIAENEELLDFRRKIEGPGAPGLQPWDVAYYAEKQRKALFDFDEEALRPYFPVERVVSGMFQIVQQLFGVTVQDKSGVPAWDPQVKYYEIRDQDGKLLGSFYADWFPRENKRGGAWMDAFLTGGPTRGGAFEPHLGAICGNLTPPVAGRPALLTHREVETIFHEFGHLLHHCLSEVEIRTLSGTRVPWDFVELPSQIMENWCWEREALDLFACHYETGEPIPEDLFQKMKKARNFRSANAQMRQVGFGVVDLALHMDYPVRMDGEVVSYTQRILQQFSPVTLPPDHAMIASFTHLFSSPVAYAAGYYSYKWAEVLDADAFTRFRQEGIFNRETGLQFRERILSKGDSDDPAQLYRSFMGRDPDLTPLLERLGLAGSSHA